MTHLLLVVYDINLKKINTSFQIVKRLKTQKKFKRSALSKFNVSQGHARKMPYLAMS